MAGSHCLALWLALATGAALPAAAEDAFLIPVAPRAPLELGTAWSAATAGPRGALGTCIEADGTDRRAGEPPSFSLVTLSRAGGRLVLGVYVSVPVATETLQGARLTDAARRMAASQPDAFRALCGDGFIAALTQGASYVAELEVDPRDAARASDALAAGHRLGTTSDRDRFREAVESVTTQFRVVTRELPGGSHAAATPVVPAAMLRRALAIAGAGDEETARPYLATFVPYPKDAVAGVAIDVGAASTRDREAEQVFLWDRRGAGVGSAQRAAELRKAQSHSESSAPASPSPPGQGDELSMESPPLPPGQDESPGIQSSASPPRQGGGLEYPASGASGAARSEAQPSEVNRRATAQHPTTLVASEATGPPGVSPQGAEGAAQRGEAERSSSGRAVAQQDDLLPRAALVFATPAGTEVYATTEAPPGVYSELVGHRRYWVPGAAEGTAAVKDAIRAASAGTAPARGTTVLCAASGVVLTDAPPLAGVHSETAGSLHAWIAGVAKPSPAEQQALAAAARAGAAR